MNFFGILMRFEFNCFYIKDGEVRIVKSYWNFIISFLKFVDWSIVFKISLMKCCIVVCEGKK